MCVYRYHPTPGTGPEGGEGGWTGGRVRASVNRLPVLTDSSTETRGPLGLPSSLPLSSPQSGAGESNRERGGGRIVSLVAGL